jgi:2-(1,2-epoxy-1,2-dihydrophenyl)acetyl-CoA isomerase
VSWLRIEDRGAVRRIVFDRPDHKNAIPADGWGDLRDVFEDAENSAARAVVLSGAGGDFCAGADLAFDPGRLDAITDPVVGARRMKDVAAAVDRLHRLTKPVVAAVDGVAVGAGLSLALACDLVVASERARFAAIFVRRGLTLDAGSSWLLPRAVGLQRAKELALTGRIVDAAEAVRIGLCLEAVPLDRFEDRVVGLADELAAGAPVAQMFAKQAIDHAWDVSFDDALGWEGQSQSICFATADFREGVSAFLEGRDPRFEGR